MTTTRSPIAATVVVVFLLIGVPVALIRRLADGVLPTQAYDVVLIVAVTAWILVSKAILDRDSAVKSLVENRLSPVWQAHSLVEQSLVGVGFLPSKRNLEPTSVHSFALWPATTSIEMLMPPVRHEPPIGRERPASSEMSSPVLSQPTLRKEASAFPPILATEEHIVGRGDTFWSIAEQRLGDGKRWKQIEEINIGRDVTADHQLIEGDSLRSGWSVLVPLFSEVEGEQ